MLINIREGMVNMDYFEFKLSKLIEIYNVVEL